MKIRSNDNMGQAVDKAQIGEMSFWEHLDVLRASLIRIAIATVLCGIMAFLFKEEVFSVILAPKSDTFITYRLFSHIAKWTTGAGNSSFSVQLINTGLAEQFVIHMKTSVYIGFLLSSPYTLYLLFHFISPALYENEKKYSLRVVGSGYVMFILGVSLSYFLIFPLTFRFLTPTSDVFTLSLAALPIWLLYEISILIVDKTKG